MPDPVIPDPQPAPPPICPRCGAEVSAADRFCAGCGFELAKPAQPVAQPAAPAPPSELPLKPGTAKLMDMLRRLMHKPESGASRLTPSGEHRALTDMDKDELAALAKVLEAKRSPVDRWITLGLIPLMLLIAGPAVTYYFATRADQQQAVVQQTNDEVARLATTTDKLEKLVVDAGERVEKMDESRAEELMALRVIVQRLEGALRVLVLREAVERTAMSYVPASVRYDKTVGAKRAALVVLAKRRGDIVAQVQAQVREQFPDMAEGEAKQQVERLYDRYLEQQQVQKE